MNTIRERLAFLFATWFGLGTLPKMPGTWGSLGALPFAWALWQLPLAFAWIVFAVFLFIAVWASGVVDQAKGGHDNQNIVVDEVAGIFLTTSVAGDSLLHFALAFIFFRLFDIWKPWPVRWLDRRVGGGLGVVVDDLAAAVYALLCLKLVISLI